MSEDLQDFKVHDFKMCISILDLCKHKQVL